MKDLPLSNVCQLLEPGPVVLLTTASNGRAKVMAMSWHMMVELEPPLLPVSSAAQSQLCRIAGDERVRDRRSGARTGTQSRGSRKPLGPGRREVREIRADAGANPARGAPVVAAGFAPGPSGWRF